MDSIPFLQSLGYMGAISPEVENIIGAGTGLRRESKAKFSDSDTDNEFEVISNKPPVRRKPKKDEMTKEAYEKADAKFRKSRGVVGLVKLNGKQVPVFDPKLHNKQYYSNK